MALARKYKIKRKKDFDRVWQEGQAHYQDWLSLRLLRNGLSWSRFAFLIGLKVSKKAVERNKVRRRLEQGVEFFLSQIKTGFDIVFLVKPAIKEKGYQEIKQSLALLLKRAKLI